MLPQLALNESVGKRKAARTGDSGMYECLSCRPGQLLMIKKENAAGQLRVYIFGMVLMWRLSSGLSTPVTALVIFFPSTSVDD